jgi:hypothetical protein
MQKFMALDALDAPQRQKSKAPLVYLFVLILLATPPLFELAKVQAARYELFGLSAPVDTPLLDYLSKTWEFGRSDVRDWMAPYLVNRRWKPEYVIPLAFFFTAIGALMLRRGC